MKQIDFDGIGEILSKKELQNVVGGCGGGEGTGSGNNWFYCEYSGSDANHTSDCLWSLNSAITYCEFWASFGYNCSCYPCSRF